MKKREATLPHQSPPKTPTPLVTHGVSIIVIKTFHVLCVCQFTQPKVKQGHCPSSFLRLTFLQSPLQIKKQLPPFFQLADGWMLEAPMLPMISIPVLLIVLLTYNTAKLWTFTAPPGVRQASTCTLATITNQFSAANCTTRVCVPLALYAFTPPLDWRVVVFFFLTLLVLKVVYASSEAVSSDISSCCVD